MPQAFDHFVNELRLLYNDLVDIAQEIHSEEDVTPGMRAVLENLLVDGPGTVPEIARRRHVTRQHIQVLVNELLDLDLVALQDNPAHKRSPVVQLSGEGSRTIRRMQRNERRWLERVDLGVAPATLQKTTSTMERIRRSLEESR